MAFTYAQIMREASTILQDEGATRWTAPELKAWIDLAVNDIFTAKPTAKVAVVDHPLAAGSKQELDADYAMVIRFVRNTSGAAVSMLNDLTTLDRWQPGWAAGPGADNVRFVFHDPLTPRIFRVAPPATALASLEMEVAVRPTPGAVPEAAPDQIDPTKYVAEVDLPDHYRTAVLHLALYRAFLKDADNPAAAAQAQGNMEIGQKVLTDIIGGEAVASAGARSRTTGPTKG